MARSKKAEREQQQKAAFLGALSECGHVTDACKAAKLPRRTAYNWRDADEAFATAWDEAQELGTDALEDEAVRRASQGVDEPVFYKGRACGKVRKYSDTLLIFLLKARRPEKFKERVSSELTGKDGAPLIPPVIQFVRDADPAE